MVVFPPCKINLGLHIISKRPDGYHNLETCFYPVPWTDILEIIPAAEFTFTSSGDIIPGKPEENLCVKAYQLLQQHFHIPPVQIHLHKIIPTGAGLGGGSADAAYTLRLLNEIFELKLTAEQLNGYAIQLGSDCPFFIQDHPMLGRGRGEILEPVSIDLRGYFLVIIKPDSHISTAEAYAGVNTHEPNKSVTNILTGYPVEGWPALLKNGFEENVFGKYPEVRHIKEMLYATGALYASMSGSGSAVFGLFRNETKPNLVEKYTTWSGWL